MGPNCGRLTIFAAAASQQVRNARARTAPSSGYTHDDLARLHNGAESAQPAVDIPDVLRRDDAAIGHGLVAVEASCISDESMPWMSLGLAPGVEVKFFKADPIRGEVIALLKAPAEAKLPRHRHSGTVVVYTLKGRWK